MDVEVPGNKEHLADLAKAITLSHKNGIVLYLSNPAFEVWLLAHFKRIAKSFIDCDAVITALNKHWRKSFRQGYKKNDRQIYTRLEDKTQDAITNAKWVRETHHCNEPNIVKCNSSTDFYKVVQKLLALNPSGS
jgi:hypothetical protein